MQRCYFCAVYQGPSAKRRGACFSWVVKNNFPSYTDKKQKGESIVLSLGYYTALQGVGSYWKSFTVYIFTVLTCDTKKERALQNIWYAWQWTFRFWVFLSWFIFWKRKENVCCTQDKKPHHEDKERLMNLQQGHIIMQWPSQTRLLRWVELVWITNQHLAVSSLWPTLFNTMGGYLEVR